MAAKAKAKTTAKKKPAASSRMTKKRAMDAAGYQHVTGWVPAELAKEIRQAIKEAAPGQTKPGTPKAARKMPRSTTKGRAPATKADQLAAGALAMGLLPLHGGTREDRIARTG